MTTATLPTPLTSLQIPTFAGHSARSDRNELAISIPSSTRTLAGFREWILNADLPRFCRVSYCSGEVFIDMSPERLGSHNAVKSELNYVLYKLVRTRKLGQYFSDGALVSNEFADVSNEPDAVFLSTTTLTSGKARLVPSADGKDIGEIEGIPDLVCEVVSPSSITKDTIKLRERYHRAGIAEYWLIDAMGDEIRFDILRHTLAGYEPAVPIEGWIDSTVFASRFRLERELDLFGLWQYTLHVASLDSATT